MSQPDASVSDVSSPSVVSSSPDTHPPIVRSLNTIYADSKAASQRYSSLVDSFATFFGASPDFIARAPGRVNLIGEHIDYSGFSVLPMAIARDTLIATRICRPEGTAAQAKAPVAPGSKRIAERQSEEISVMNNEPDAYPEATFSCLGSKDASAGGGAAPKSNAALLDHPSVLDIKAPGSSAAAVLASASGEDAEEDSAAATGWTKYVQCGIKGVWEAEQRRRADAAATTTSHTTGSEAAAPGGVAGAALPDPPRRLPGMQMLVDGSVPPAAGLSSSSSLVCCSALATAYALELSAAGAAPAAEASHLSSFSKLDLASLSANCERYIGTAGGGMDQSISFLATSGFASHISFEPRLACEPVRLPPGALFLVAHSGRQSEKAKTAATQFNKRVLECTLAAHVIAKSLGVCMYATPKHDAAAAAATSAPSTQQPQAGEIPKLTLHDVLQASGKSLKEMIEFLQQPASNAAASFSAGPPLHIAPYTLAELHAFFSTNTLKPLLAFRPTLIDALGEDVASPSVRARKLGASSAASKPKVRVAFGRSVQSYSDRNSASDPVRALPYSTVPVAAGFQAQSARDKPFPWQIAAEMDRKRALAESIAATNPSSIVPAMDSAAASVVASKEAVTPYRNQGDPELSSADQLAARSSLQRHPLLIQSINRFWVLLSKDPATGELRKEDYMLFFLRLCKLVNPDLSFEESWKIIAEDWNRDVARTRLKNKEDAAALLAESKAKGKSRAAALAEKYNSKPSTGASAAGSGSASQADLPSIPYSTFFSSLFELVDLWCSDSNATNYAELLDQLFQKLTVKVETRSEEEEMAQAAREAAGGKDASADQFLLLQRALHVYSEALRVEEFAALCAEASKGTSDPSAVLESLGALMNASHVSCARSYDCSTDDLDVLVNLCVQKAGAVGARLTGAGWGGCAVALFDASVFVPDGASAEVARVAHAQSVDRILDIIISEYYRAHCGMDERDPQRDNWRDLLFVSEPAAGAAIVLAQQKA